MKKIEIEIPEGKCAQWIDGILTLVDEKPKDITERIKTFKDACEALGNEHPLVTEYKIISEAYDIKDDLYAYLKLRIICAALNEEWKPTFNENDRHYYPWFYIYTKEGYEELDENEKKECYVPLRSNGSAYAGGGLVYAGAKYAGSYSSTAYGVRLAFKTRELAKYCGKQFIDIWADFLFS